MRNAIRELGKEPTVELREVSRNSAEHRAYIAMMMKNRAVLSDHGNITLKSYQPTEVVPSVPGPRTPMPLAICVNNVLVGGIVVRPVKNDEETAEIGFFVVTASGWEVIATAALKKLITGHPAHETFIAETNPDNVQTQRVLEHAGFHFDKENENGDLVYKYERQE